MPDQEIQKDRWTIYVCPICGEEQPGLEEGEVDLTQPDNERDDEGYLICDGVEEHDPVRFAPVEVCRVSELEAAKERSVANGRELCRQRNRAEAAEKEKTEAMAWAAGWETDGYPPFDFEMEKDRWPEKVYVAVARKGTLGPFVSIEPGRLHADDPDSWDEREYIPPSELESETKRLREELREVEAVAVRRYDECNSVERGATAAEKALREAVDAGRILASYTQGFSENRTVAEAKESIERAASTLAVHSDKEDSHA